MNAWMLVFLAAIVNSVAGMLLKQSRVVADGGAIWLLVLSPWFIAACLCYLGNTFLFAKSLDFLPLSFVYPVYAGAGFALIAIAGNLLFHEQFGVSQGVGIVLILIGIFAASRDT